MNDQQDLTTRLATAAADAVLNERPSIEMHSAFAWLCIRLDLRLDRSRRAAGVMIGPGCPNGGFVGRRGAVCQRAAPTPGRPHHQ